MTAPQTKGRLFIISAPSGGGKSTILRALLKDNSEFYYSISCTTRPRRNGETHGKEYYFITEKDFHEKAKANEFLEHARVHDNLYGTPKWPIEEALNSGRACFMDIDVQGMDSIVDQADELGWPVSTIFILPPSHAVLEERLRFRNTDPEDVIQKRLETARREVERAGRYDFRIVNENIEQAIGELKKIVREYGFAVS